MLFVPDTGNGVPDTYTDAAAEGYRPGLSIAFRGVRLSSMAKPNEPPTSSPRGPLIVMAAGGLLVAGLVGWALTRSVEPPLVTPASTDVPAAASTATPSLPETTPTPSTAPPLSASDFSIPAGGTQDSGKAEVNRMSVEDLHGKFNRGDVTIIDVRDAASYATGHIPGSLNIAMASLQTQIDTLPKGKQIVAYCT